MKKILLVALNAKYCHTSLSVRSLHAFCKKQGVDSCFVEHTINETASYILSELVKARADVYAFSCYIWNIELVKRLCRDLRQIMSDVVVLLGGPEVSFDPENPEYDFADHIICGEGEAALAAFMFTNDAYPRVINGSLTDPLSSIPFAYEDLEDIDGRLVYYESSRGCPFSCSYCLSSTISGVRFLELERVFTDLLRFEQAGVRLVKFVDRTFNANPERALKIWSFIRENCPTVSFHFEIAADLLTDEQIILLSSFEEGRIQLEIGIQSTCDNTLRAVDRNVELEKIASAVRRLRQSDNIHLHLDLIAGLPFENYERFGHSFDWVYALRPHCLQLGFLKLLKGSKIRREADQYGYRYSAVAPYQVFSNNFISFPEINRLEGIANRVEKYYNSNVFLKSLEYILQYFPSPFRFFEALNDYFEQNGYSGCSVSQKKLFQILFLFYCERVGENIPLFQNNLRFDWQLCTGGAPPPGYMGEYENIKAGFRRLLEDGVFQQTYLKHYEGQKWQEIMKRVSTGCFYFPEKKYYLFDHDRYYDITNEFLNLEGSV